MDSDGNEQNSHSRRRVLKWTAATGSALAIMGLNLPNFGLNAALAADLG